MTLNITAQRRCGAEARSATGRYDPANPAATRQNARIRCLCCYRYRLIDYWGSNASTRWQCLPSPTCPAASASCAASVIPQRQPMRPQPMPIRNSCSRGPTFRFILSCSSLCFATRAERGLPHLEFFCGCDRIDSQAIRARRNEGLKSH